MHGAAFAFFDFKDITVIAEIGPLVMAALLGRLGGCGHVSRGDIGGNLRQDRIGKRRDLMGGRLAGRRSGDDEEHDEQREAQE